MAEIRSGLRHLLAHPALYDTWATITGAHHWRERVIREFAQPRLKPGDAVLDIGCGTADVLKYLSPDIAYFGFDRNESYIARAVARFPSRRAVLKCEDVNQGNIDNYPRFDIVLALGLVHHLDDSEAHGLFALAARALKPSGALITLDPLYTTEQSRLAKYVVSKDRGQSVRTREAYKELIDQHFGMAEAHIDMQPIRIPYTGIVLVASQPRGSSRTLGSLA